MLNEKDIKPCPNCVNRINVKINHFNKPNIDIWVMCTKCGIEAPLPLWEKLVIGDSLIKEIEELHQQIANIGMFFDMLELPENASLKIAMEKQFTKFEVLLKRKIK